MCGILAFHHKNPPKTVESSFNYSLNQLYHRGPDDDGIWFDQTNAVWLGHRRLSILDLTSAGKQPMMTADERWVITFNGEIYNWRIIREELLSLGLNFKTTTDTEVLLYAINQWGILQTLKKLVGMFAFAIWDRAKKKLTIARDRFGEKPLYYSVYPDRWYVSSELKAMRNLPGFQTRLNPEAIQFYLRKKYVPEPLSIYENTYKLPPGCYAEIEINGEFEIEKYWSFSKLVHSKNRGSYQGTFDDAVVELHQLLKEIIQDQQVADVPVGAFLSGGIDSSLIVAVMQEIRSEPVHTFSIGFNEKKFDESAYARRVADVIGTHHTDLIVTPQEAQDVIPKLAEIYDEPFSDSSAIPTTLVSKLARRHVTVSLSGDAGDEIFGGYNRYYTVVDAWDRLSRLPKLARAMMGKSFNLGSWCFQSGGQHLLAYRLYQRSRHLQHYQSKYLYNSMMNMYGISDRFLKKKKILNDENPFIEIGLGYEQGMATDTLDYLPADILVKVDRAAMHHSLETRVPFLDHRLVEWAWTLPVGYKIDAEQSKKVLRHLLYQYVPKELVERPKMGFGVPVGHWIRDDLRDWAEDLLSIESLNKTNVFNQKFLRGLWHGHRDGRIDESHMIWSFLILQQWMIENHASLS